MLYLNQIFVNFYFYLKKIENETCQKMLKNAAYTKRDGKPF